MYHKRTDINQESFVAEIRQRGYFWQDMHQCGWGVADGIMCDAQKTHCEWVEIKTGPGSGLTPAEVLFFGICPGGPPILAWNPTLAIAEFERRAKC